MNIDRLHELADGWRADAAVLRRRGAAAQADALQSCAADHEQTLREWQNEELTLHEASQESGFSQSTLQQGVASGKIQNAGQHGRPRIRRRDLPYKPRRSGPKAVEGQPDLADEILASKLGGE